MKKNNIIWGLILILIGVLIGVKSLGILDINLFFDGWWALFIIIPCFVGLLCDNDKISNIIGLFVGVFLLLGAQDVISYDLIWKIALPFILIVLGFSILFKSNKKTPKLNEEGLNEYFTAFGGQDIEYGKKEFVGAEITSIFGGIKLNLKNSSIKEDVKIDASAIFGGIDIIVPENVNVSINSVPIFGGITNNIKNKDENKVTIYINAAAIFGGVKVYAKESKSN